MKTKNEIFQELKKYIYLADLLLDYNSSDLNLHQYLVKNIPDIEADLVSARENPNCSCVSKIKEYVRCNIAKCSEHLSNYSEQYDVVLELKDNTPRTELSGKVAKTTISEWSDFCKELNSMNPIYKSCSVAKDGDDLHVFFL